MSVKVYQLFGGPGGFSNDTSHYSGSSYYVAAENNRQAHYLANAHIWATDPERPLGIVDVYQRSGNPDGWHQLWCGCRIHGGLGVEHMQGVRALRTVMRDHAGTHAIEAEAGTLTTPNSPEKSKHSEPAEDDDTLF